MKPATRRLWPSQTTWVMRHHGAAFNPDRLCEYTGLALHPFPIADPAGRWMMGFWRVDGALMAVAALTPEESAWLSANPSAYQAERAEFEAWRESTNPRKHV